MSDSVYDMILTSQNVGQKELAFNEMNPNRENPIFRVNRTFEIFSNNSWENISIRGINIGRTVPGSFPGDGAITENEYYRWFEMISEMNANSIRVYDLHPPSFYEALYKFNHHSNKPLYLFQGIWISEEELMNKLDVFDDNITSLMKFNIEHTVDAIHGNILKKGKSYEDNYAYSWDISPYVLGYIIGVEWDPLLVSNTNTIHTGFDQFKGRYIETIEALPFEIWLGSIMDHTISFEYELYESQRPISFINHQLTDPIVHLNCTVKDNQVSGINPDNIVSTNNYYSGIFSSYHVYPYYPEFMNNDPEYTNFSDNRGNKNSFAGYLHKLDNIQEHPILIAEFGVPSSKGLSQCSIQSMNQGNLDEEQQGLLIASMYGDIIDQKMMGGLIFSWQDEWFKTVWNTKDLVDLDRIHLWFDPMTCEQNYGLMAFDPGDKKIILDGSPDDWGKIPSTAINVGEININSNSKIDEIKSYNDEGYLYFYIRYRDGSKPRSDQELNTFIGFDLSDKQYNMSNKSPINKNYLKRFEIIIDLSTQDNYQIVVNHDYDVFKYILNKFDANSNNVGNNSEVSEDVFYPYRMVINIDDWIDDKNGEMGPYWTNAGKLRKGNNDMSTTNYDSLANYYYSNENGLLEIRIPYLLLNFKDPSKGEIMGNIKKFGLASNEFIDSINISIIYYDTIGLNYDDILSISSGELNSYNSLSVSENIIFLNKWEVPKYSERLKESYYIIKNEFGDC